jgi:hypothetical protein
MASFKRWRVSCHHILNGNRPRAMSKKLHNSHICRLESRPAPSLPTSSSPVDKADWVRVGICRIANVDYETDSLEHWRSR